MDAVILVGGGGTRLRPLTYALPKPLIPVLNRPLVVRLIDSLRAHGVSRVVLAGASAERRIEEALGGGSRLGVELSYSYEEVPLGSGLAVKQAARDFDRAFFVCNGDVVSDLDYSAMADRHRSAGAMVSISLSPVEDPSAFGVVELSDGDRITRFVEKPPLGEAPSNWANAGCWLFEPEILEHIPDERMDRSLVFPSLIAEGFVVQGFPTGGYWMDVGTSERYLQLHKDLLNAALPRWLPEGIGSAAAVGEGCEIGEESWLGACVLLGEGCQVLRGARVEGPSVLGEACSLGDAAIIERSVLWPRVVTGARAIVRDSVVGEGCVIGEGAVVEGAVLANGARVAAGVRLPLGARLEPGEAALSTAVP